MNGYTAKSRIYQRQKARRLKRRRTARKRLFIFFITVIAVSLGVIGLKLGLETSRSFKYPVAYSEYISKYASENELDPYLVMALIKQESNYVADARSPYAGGLMQLTEATAEEYGKKLGLENFNYMDPETNIKIGCYVLKSLINRYDVIDTALAAYNAGLGNVDEWLDNPQYSSDGVTLDYIPFSETRHYIRKINEYIIEYKELSETNIK